ncbi:hypothetical protein [Cedecea sp.]|jgi:hypothetical protein|uniref:hypothetical protein n=1 Tax=Cedecea sp. TaxID=1970739 RepID=UPI002F42AF62
MSQFHKSFKKSKYSKITKDNKSDKIIFNEINEMHASILEISKYSFEVKKLCITTIGVFNGFLLSNYNFKKPIDIDNEKIISITLCITFIITILFHIADAATYFYQKSNRVRQNKYKNKILIKNNLSPITTKKSNWFSSLFNNSMIIYFVIYGIILFLSSLISKTLSPAIIYTLLSIAIAYYKSNKKPKIFVSYTTRDHKIDIYLLEHLSGIIKKHGFISYIDIINNDSNNKQERVYDELLSADAMIIFGSDGYSKSKWALEEYKIAKKTEKEIVIIQHNDDRHQIEDKIKKLHSKTIKFNLMKKIKHK